MESMSTQDYKALFTEVIKKQIILLGPNITLAKARNVKGLTVLEDGTVSEINGDPQELIQALIDQFVQLSGLIVKKTMEPLLNVHSGGANIPLPVNTIVQAAQAQSTTIQTPVTST